MTPRSATPRSVWRFPADKQRSKLHSTQKPVALIEQLIKTYSNPGDIGLDFCAGSGTFGEACDNTGRGFVVIEKGEQEFQTLTNRLNHHANQNT